MLSLLIASLPDLHILLLRGPFGQGWREWKSRQGNRGPEAAAVFAAVPVTGFTAAPIPISGLRYCVALFCVPLSFQSKLVAVAERLGEESFSQAMIE